MNISSMVVYSCKKCGELNYLTPHAFWNITDFGAQCERCETINTITLENGELKKQVYSELATTKPDLKVEKKPVTHVKLPKPLCLSDVHPFGNLVHHPLVPVKTSSLHLFLYYYFHLSIVPILSTALYLLVQIEILL